MGSGGGVEDVDSTRVRPAVAFQHFAGALYTGSGSISGGGIGGQNVSSFESGSNALVAGGSSSSIANGGPSNEDSQSIRLKFESPFVKLQRLQDELKEFHVELREAAASAPKSGGEANAQQDIWSNLSGNVQQLQGQLDAMLSQPQVKQMMLQTTGAGDASAATSPSSSGSLLPQFDSLFDQYVAELTANPSFQPFPTPAAAAADSAASYSSSTVASSPELVALPKLDERLNVLEKLLGTSAGSKQAPSLPMLAFNAPAASSAAVGGAAAPSTTVLPAPDLLTALASLHAQMAQLNPQRLEFISRSCKQILIEQESIAISAKQIKEDALSAGSSTAASPKAAVANNNETPATTTATDAAARPYAAQIAHLYALTSRWDTLALTLPTLIARLSSLHTLHASSATLAARVSGLERQSGAIDAAITAQREGMQAVSKAAADNLAAIQANFKAMDARIQLLTQKMEQLK